MNPVEVYFEPVRLGSHAGLSVAAAIDSSTTRDIERLFTALDDALAQRGLVPADIVRNRLFAPSRDVRDAASAERFRHLAGPARCATSSYVDERRFPTGDGVAIETVALAAAGDAKLVVEHEPLQPPCRFVAVGEVVVLSGLASTRPTLPDQLDEIRARLLDTLAVAQSRLAARVQPMDAAAWIHRSDGGDGLVDLAERVALDGMVIRIERCDGFSKPGKLIELEVDGALVSRA